MHITPIRTPDLGDTSYLITHDGSGLRSSIAAGFLASRGFTPIVLDVGGSDDVVNQLAVWEASCEPPLEVARR